MNRERGERREKRDGKKNIEKRDGSSETSAEEIAGRGEAREQRKGRE